MYVDRSDYRQALLLSWKVVDSDAPESLKLQAYKRIGLCYLYTGEDMKARDAFNEVLKRDSYDLETLINLAGLLKHYRQDEEATELYLRLPGQLKLQNAGLVLHPVAREMYDASVNTK
jgi:tetratricopeptide (TPR) repeat protein